MPEHAAPHTADRRVPSVQRTLVIVTHSEVVAARADRTLALERGHLSALVQSPELARQAKG